MQRGKSRQDAGATRNNGKAKKNERVRETSSILRGVLLRWHRQDRPCYPGDEKCTGSGNFNRE